MIPSYRDNLGGEEVSRVHNSVPHLSFSLKIIDPPSPLQETTLPSGDKLNCVILFFYKEISTSNWS